MSETPIEVTAPSLVTPDLSDVPESDIAEPDDADVEHVVPDEELS